MNATGQQGGADVVSPWLDVKAAGAYVGFCEKTIRTNQLSGGWDNRVRLNEMPEDLQIREFPVGNTEEADLAFDARKNPPLRLDRLGGGLTA